MRVICRKISEECGRVYRQPIQEDSDHFIGSTSIRFEYYFVDTEKLVWHKLKGKLGYHLREAYVPLNSSVEEFITNMLTITPPINYDTLPVNEDDDGWYEITEVLEAEEVTVESIKMIMECICKDQFNSPHIYKFISWVSDELKKRSELCKE